MECCKIKNPAADCTPSDSWVPIQECQNLMFDIDFRCTFELKKGISVDKSTSQGTSLAIKASASLEASAKVTGGILSASFKASVGYSQTTGYNWQQSESNMWKSETKETLDFFVKPGVKVVVEQVMGSCGAFRVGAPKYRTREV